MNCFTCKGDVYLNGAVLQKIEDILERVKNALTGFTDGRKNAAFHFVSTGRHRGQKYKVEELISK